MPFDRVLGLLVLIPVRRAHRVATDPEVADFALLHLPATIVQDPRIVTLDHLAARSGAYRAGAIRDEHVQRLGRTDAVDDVDAVALLEPFEQRRRQRLSSRHGK